MKYDITDHAILRYLERGCGVKISSIRRHLERAVDISTLESFSEFAVMSDGLRFHFRRAPDGIIKLITVTSAQEDLICNRARRRKLRRKK